MPKKYFRKFLPDHATIRQSRWIRPFGTWLHHPNLWHLHRRSVAGGVAIGMFCGLIPGPFQMIGAALLAVLFRVNLPVAVFTTLYTNPFTIVPLYVLAYELGAFVTGQQDGLSSAYFALPEMSWSNWHTVLLDWVMSLGKPFAVGLPLLALSLAIAGYFVVRALWYAVVVWEWRRRAARRGKGR
ncbi:MAG: DUF2062 domain-containing protein [Betaproteobacteria bacterium]|nr:DUF2062 domain-containing protein [Betaproteobacteria bacterium]MDE2310211.1 DUF2062 domain-containing protein [Betaproteobacteria bacterium]